MNPPPAPAWSLSLASRLVLWAWRMAGRVLLPLYLVGYLIHALRRPATRQLRLARLRDLCGQTSTLASATKASRREVKTQEVKKHEVKTLWVHAVSAGELAAGIRLIEKLLRLCEKRNRAEKNRAEKNREEKNKTEKNVPENTPQTPWRVLVTTTTLSSARYAERFLPAGVAHRFLPLDVPRPVARFLKDEQVRLGILIESEIWPTLAHQCLQKNIPLIVASTRLSPRSYARAKRYPALARILYSLPRLFLARHPQEVQGLQNLGAREVQVAGELKDAALPPAVAPDALAKLQAQLKDAPCWVAVSAHRDETEAVLATHKGLLEAGLGEVVTLLCPRRPLDKTLEKIVSLLEANRAHHGIAFARRSLNQDLPIGGGIYLCDSFGEVGLWCSLASVAFVGGSLVNHGGHNPREPAWFSCGLFMGQYFHNQSRAVEALVQAGGLEVVKDTQELIHGIARQLKEGAENQAGKRAYALVAQEGETALNQTLKALQPFLDGLDRE